jgi:UDP-N-acetyl-D-mannosaminuronate dehydrogenase
LEAIRQIRFPALEPTRLLAHFGLFVVVIFVCLIENWARRRNMKIAVVGAGAMGSLFGALLAESGNEVWLCDIRQDHIHAVRQNGLMLEYESQTRVVKRHAVIDPLQIGQSDKDPLAHVFEVAQATSA